MLASTRSICSSWAATVIREYGSLFLEEQQRASWRTCRPGYSCPTDWTPLSVQLVWQYRKLLRPIMVALPAAGLVMGLATQLLGQSQWAGGVWLVATLPVLLVVWIEIVVSLRRGDIGLD